MINFSGKRAVIDNINQLLNFMSLFKSGLRYENDHPGGKL